MSAAEATDGGEAEGRVVEGAEGKCGGGSSSVDSLLLSVTSSGPDPSSNPSSSETVSNPSSSPDGPSSPESVEDSSVADSPSSPSSWNSWLSPSWSKWNTSTG